MMKFSFFIIFISLLVQNGQSDLVATANIHIDSTEIGIGTILFHQKDAGSPVRVVGIIDGLKSNTVHVCFSYKKQLNSIVYLGFSCTQRWIREKSI